MLVAKKVYVVYREVAKVVFYVASVRVLPLVVARHVLVAEKPVALVASVRQFAFVVQAVELVAVCVFVAAAVGNGEKVADAYQQKSYEA